MLEIALAMFGGLLFILIVTQVLMLRNFRHLKAHLRDLVVLRQEDELNQQLALEKSLSEFKGQFLQLLNQHQSMSERNFGDKLERLQRIVLKAMLDYKEAQKKSTEELFHILVQQYAKQREQDKAHAEAMLEHGKNQQVAILDSINQLKIELLKELHADSVALSKKLEGFIHTLMGIVEQRLNEGFDKSTKTFNEVIERLAMIDSAQKKITELSTNVVSLQEVLSDKRSRGAFGEVQLNALIENMLPKKNYAFQYRLSNRKIVDCMLFLPQPTGNVGIDAKFPLESYQTMTNSNLPLAERRLAERRFRADVKKHIDDITMKYILPNETSGGAIMFIPAEAVFAEIHANHPELIEKAHQQRVWVASPTTLMAILTTASAVVKDEATRKQVHIIQEHLAYLAKDFNRFQKRIDNLSQHMGKVNQDVQDVAISATKITNRFNKIENVELEKLPSKTTLETSE